MVWGTLSGWPARVVAIGIGFDVYMVVAIVQARAGILGLSLLSGVAAGFGSYFWLLRDRPYLVGRLKWPVAAVAAVFLCLLFQFFFI